MRTKADMHGAPVVRFGLVATKVASFGRAFTSLLCGTWGVDHPQPNNGPATEPTLRAAIANSDSE
jgi:hypothetical protein